MDFQYLKHGGVNDDMLYQLQLRRQELLVLCQRWKASVQVIPSNEPSETWGPSVEELHSANFGLVAGGATYINVERDMSDDEEVIESDMDEAASGEDDLLESITFTDIYNYNGVSW
jgi:hypothetical protein